MSKYTTIKMVKRIEKKYLEPNYNQFVIKYDWLRKLLVKFGWISNALDECTKYETIEFKTDEFVKDLLAKYYYACNLNKQIRHVYMGPEDFDELLSNKRAHEMGIFNIDFTVPISYNRTVFNVPVTVVPYMKGVLFV